MAKHRSPGRRPSGASRSGSRSRRPGSGPALGPVLAAAGAVLGVVILAWAFRPRAGDGRASAAPVVVDSGAPMSEAQKRRASLRSRQRAGREPTDTAPSKLEASTSESSEPANGGDTEESFIVEDAREAGEARGATDTVPPSGDGGPAILEATATALRGARHEGRSEASAPSASGVEAASSVRATSRKPGDEAAFVREVGRLETTLAGLRAGPTGEAPGAKMLLDEVAGVVRAGRQLPGYALHVERLRQLHRAAFRLGKGWKDHLGSRTFASSVAWQDGRATLTYDFKTQEQVRDLHPIGGAMTALRWGRGRLSLRGEARLLEGDPFEGALAVQLKVPPGGYDPAAPNINCALFTAASDRLIDLDRKLPSVLGFLNSGRDVAPEDIVVFALGYWCPVAEYGGNPLYSLNAPNATDPVAMPLIALFLCRKGALLHSDPREALQVLPLGEPLRAGVSLEARVDAQGARWTVNSRRIIDGKAPALSRIGGRTKPRTGSVTLLPGPSEVVLSSLVVEGALRQEWLLEGVEEEAERAFKALEEAARPASE